MHQISFWFFQRGITPEGEITRTRKKNVCLLFFHEEFHVWHFKTLASTVLDERTDGRTDARTHNLKPICPVNFFEAGGIITQIVGVWPKFNVLVVGLDENQILQVVGIAFVVIKWICCCINQNFENIPIYCKSAYHFIHSFLTLDRMWLRPYPYSYPCRLHLPYPLLYPTPLPSTLTLPPTLSYPTLPYHLHLPYSVLPHSTLPYSLHLPYPLLYPTLPHPTLPFTLPYLLSCLTLPNPTPNLHPTLSYPTKYYALPYATPYTTLPHPTSYPSLP